VRTRRENWGGSYRNVTRDDQGRIKTWSKWSPRNDPADKEYNAQGFARRNYARGVADRVERKEITRGSIGKQELNEYTISMEFEGSKGKRSPARIKELRLTTPDELKEEDFIETIRRLAREDKNVARWIERYDEISEAVRRGAKLRDNFNAGKTTDRYVGVRLS